MKQAYVRLVGIGEMILEVEDSLADGLEKKSQWAVSTLIKRARQGLGIDNKKAVQFQYGMVRGVTTIG